MSKFSPGADFSKPAKAYIEHRDFGVVESNDGQKGWVEVISSKHPTLQRLERRAKQEGVKRANQLARGMKTADATLEDVESRNLEYLCAAVQNWKIVDLSGQVRDDIRCTEENKREILSDPNWNFVRDTIDSAVVNDLVFMPNSKLHLPVTPSPSSSLEPPAPQE